MDSVLSKIKGIVFNIFYFKIVLLVLSLCTLLVPLADYTYRVLFVALAWGALLCLYDLFTKRNFLKAKRVIWLIAFIISFAISVALNYYNSLNLNFSSWAYTVFSLLVLYPNNVGGSKERVIKEISILNNIYIAITAVLSTISFGMFGVQYLSVTHYGDATYVVGWYSNRLFGLYSNTGLMMTAIGIAIIFIQMQVNKLKYQKTPLPIKIFLGYTLFINFICMSLENSSGAYISLASFFAVLFFFKIRFYNWKQKFAELKRFLFGTLAAGFSVVVLLGSIYTVRLVLPYFPSVICCCQDVFRSEEDKQNAELEKIELERDIPASYGAMTGRPKIWAFGMQQFVQKPIFGYGPNSHRQYKVLDLGLRHFHNLIVQCLVSVGIVGSLFIFIFLILSGWELIVKLWKRRLMDLKHYNIVLAIVAFLIMLAVNSMGEVTILFLVRPSMFMFWYYLGYVVILADDGKPSKFDKPMIKLNDKINQYFSSKKQLKENLNEK